MKQRDYYEVLGVRRDVADKDLKRAYHKLAMQYHPDRNQSPEAEEKFKEASEAYEVLSDPDKRRIYDTAGFDGLRSSGFSGFQGVEDIFSSFGDIFGDLFGFRGARGPGGARRGRDLKAELAIEFHEAAFGCQKSMSIPQLLACRRCGGEGAEPGTRPSRCGTCQGRGQVMHGQGMFLVTTTCPECRGQGVQNTHPCRDCRGAGRSEVQRDIKVNVPAGFDDGMSLRYSGEGEAGERGGPPGDLYVVIAVRPHQSLRREGDDLIAEARISMIQAALGGEVSVEGLEGPEGVKIAKGTQPGTIHTLRRKGMPRLRGGGRGDLHVVCKVEIPTSLSPKQKKLLEEFDGAGKKRSLFD
jgi:molecular chaperone DnaJ